MSDTLSATPELLVLRRPNNITDGRWAVLQSLAHKVVQGHYPWCTEHQEAEDERSGWCLHSDKSRVAEVVLHSGGLRGRLTVDVRGIVDGEVILEDWDPIDAAVLADQIERLYTASIEVDPLLVAE